MENKLPKGYALKLLKSCELGAKKTNQSACTSPKERLKQKPKVLAAHLAFFRFWIFKVIVY